MLINLITEFFNLVTLIGVVILSRHASKNWQLIIGVTLVILGLVLGVK